MWVVYKWMLLHKCKGFNNRISPCFTGGKTDSREGQNEQFTTYGKVGSGTEGLYVGSRAYTCPKRSGHAKREGKSEINFDFLLSKPPHTHHLSLEPQIAEKMKKWPFAWWKNMSFMKAWRVLEGSVFSIGGLIWLLSSSSTLSSSLFHLRSSFLWCLPW